LKSLLASKISFKEYFADILFDLVNIKENRNISTSVIINQIFFTGLEAVTIVSVVSLLLGAVIIQQGYMVLDTLGQRTLIYNILVSAIIRDFGPFIVSFIILARSGTAISTELGNMMINKEIDALKAFGISPISYIVNPRVVGVVISIVVLMIYFSIFGIFGGYLASTMFNALPFSDFFNNFIGTLRLIDIVLMITKSALSGFAIAVICSYHGLSVKVASTEVPQRNIMAVAHSVYAIFAVHLLGVLAHVWVMGLI